MACALDRAGGDGQFRAMQAAVRRPSEETYLCVAGEIFRPTGQGALWWERKRTLIVSDLHLEKGSNYARRGQLLPPYDTSSTLRTVEALIASLTPDKVISLGDSFHDPQAESRLDESDRRRIQALTAKTDWIWVEGNHDPDPPAHLGGRGMKHYRTGACVFRHEPTGETGEIAGHLHPVARVSGRGKSVRRKCFVTDGTTLIMPSMGAYTGGLNVLDPAITSLFGDGAMIFAVGAAQVHFVDRKMLEQERNTRTGARGWRL